MVDISVGVALEIDVEALKEMRDNAIAFTEGTLVLQEKGTMT